MAEDIVAAISADRPTVRMDAVMNEGDLNADKTDAASRTFDHAMQTALDMPGGAPAAQQESSKLTTGGAVGLEKAAMLSNVDPNGVRMASTVQDKEMDALADRVRTLYQELMNWQVAWGISHRVQQDSSQLLKGQ